MDARERELTQRHLDKLIDMRDNAWGDLYSQPPDVSTRRPIARYEALSCAIAALREKLAP